MITFNTILKSEGIDPQHVKLIRHRSDNLYTDWLHDKSALEGWQKFQAKQIFSGAKIIASFIGMSPDETVFVGLYSVNGSGDLPDGYINPRSGKVVTNVNTETGEILPGKHILYELSSMPELMDYQGKLLVDWGRGYLAWSQRAKDQDKTVCEVRRVVSEPPFPGYLKFQTRLKQLASVPASWRTALSSVSGVYLLVNPESGKQYVGIATGTNGF